MNKLLLVSLLVTFALSQTATSCPSGQYLYNFQCIPNTCTSYISRIGTTAAGAGGNGTVPLNTQGTIQNNGGNVVVTFQFKDIEKDGIFNRDNSNSCISSELIRLNQLYVPQAYNETTITSTYDAASGYRNWSFTITPSQYAALTFASVSTNVTTYTGYFAYRFNVSSITQYTYYFSFSFGVNTQTQAGSGFAQFQPLITVGKLACAPNDPNNCIAKIDTAVGFSTSPSCTTVTPTATVVLNSNMFLCVSITNAGFSSYVLSSPTITFTGNGLNYVAPIAATQISGIYTAYTVSVPFVYTNVAVTVAAAANPKSRLLGESRLLADVSGTPATGKSADLGCIKVSATSTGCPTAAELAANPPPASTTTTNTNGSTANAYVIGASMLAILLI